MKKNMINVEKPHFDIYNKQYQIFLLLPWHHMKIFGLLILMLSNFTAVFSQETKSAYAGWGAGTIILNDGIELKGSVQHHDKIGAINFRLDSISEPERFQVTEVSRINYIDPKSKQERFFFSIPTVGLCELLLELNDFSLISSMSTLRIQDLYEGTTLILNSTPNTTTVSSKSVFSQTENIFFLNKNGAIDYYLQINNFYTDDATLDKSKTIIVDNNLLSKYTKEYWPNVLAFAKKKKLKFNRKEDVIEILNHYKSLLEN